MEGDSVPPASKTCPVSFDHHSPQHANHYLEKYAELRETCPRAWTETYGGFWIATRYDDVLAIAQAKESFTSDKTVDPVTGEVNGGNTIPSLSPVRLVPNESDSPEWEGVRGFLNRHFAPKVVEARRERTRTWVRELLDRVIESGKIDFVDDLTNPLPGYLTMEVFGFPLEEWDRFADPAHRLVYLAKDEEGFQEAHANLDYFRQRVDEEIEARRSEPRDDLLGVLANGLIDGAPLDRKLIQEIAWQILAGGVDTTTALTSNALVYLGRDPAQRQRLIDEPELLPIACEEFVRFASPVHGPARNAKMDVELNGWRFDKGDRVILSYTSANRDPAVFEDPEELRIDRFPNRHLGFGAGMHRCLGNGLARMAFQEMMSGVLSRMPDYRLVEEGLRRYKSVGFVNGWIHIPAEFSPGPRLAAD
jgi:cytochrome P450